jgi:hypothetical protein
MAIEYRYLKDIDKKQLKDLFLSVIENRKSNATAPRFSLCLWAFCGGWLLHCLCCFL